MKHTPGPWWVSHKDPRCVVSARVQICKCWMSGGGVGNENTRLIAAAPDLLEALKAILNGPGVPDLPADLLNLCTSAIAKAIGETK